MELSQKLAIILAQEKVPEREITNPLITPQLKSLTGESFAGQFIPMLITLAFVIASIIFLFIMLLAGISWMMAGGDKAQVESARARLTNGLIGLFIVFTVFALLGVLEGLFGVDLLTIDLSKLII